MGLPTTVDGCVEDGVRVKVRLRGVVSKALLPYLLEFVALAPAVASKVSNDLPADAAANVEGGLATVENLRRQHALEATPQRDLVLVAFVPLRIAQAIAEGTNGAVEERASWLAAVGHASHIEPPALGELHVVDEWSAHRLPWFLLAKRVVAPKELVRAFAGQGDLDARLVRSAGQEVRCQCVADDGWVEALCRVHGGANKFAELHCPRQRDRPHGAQPERLDDRLHCATVRAIGVAQREMDDVVPEA